MKVIEDYYVQPRAYADSYGKCAILLEDGETLEDVEKKYVKPKKEWFEERYFNPTEVSEYVVKKYNGEIIKYTGRIIVMDTKRCYLD